jgi:DNA-binding beta-propeller fold protein YncE
VRTVLDSGRIRPINNIRRHSRLLRSFVVSLACWSVIGACGNAEGASRRIALEKPPTSVVLSRDGRALYVGLDRHFGVDGGIAKYRRDGNTFSRTAELAVPEGVLGLAITSDEQTVVASTPVGLVAVQVKALERGDPAAASVRDGDAPGTNQLVISRDDRYVLYTNERAANLGIVRLGAPRSPTDKPELTIVGHVPLDRAPGGLVLSHDGRTLFVTSEIDNVDPGVVAGAGDSRLGRTRCEVNLGPSGVLTVVSVAAAIRTPESAVLVRTAAGCAPVRVALAPDGKVVWITDRGEARVLAFDVSRLRRGPGSLLASVGVGNGPVGIAVSPDGRSVLVANSNRTGPSERSNPGTLSLISVETVLHGTGDGPVTLGAGAQPREVVAAPDGTFLVTDYDGRSIEVVSPDDKADARGILPPTYRSSATALGPRG